MTVDDAYSELGLLPGASLAQAKTAWRTLVSHWHPDRNGHASASARMQRINQALEHLRSATDGRAGAQSGSDAGPAPGPAHTVHRRVTLTLEEAAAGCIKILQGSVIAQCGDCAGSGQVVQPQECAACAGKGSVMERNWFGWFGPAIPCTTCNGSGKLRPKCQTCDGSGKAEAARYRVSVRLPADIHDGDLLHVTTAHGRTVALDIQVELLPHAHLLRDDDGTVRCEWPVDGFGWIANRTVDIPTLWGTKPLGLQRGQVMYRLAGQGFRSRGDKKRADQLVIIVPRFPAQLSREQERLLAKLAATTLG